MALVWNRPENDGGSKLIGYYAESQKVPGETWVRHNANCQNVPKENFIVTGLEEGSQYKFRIIAKTAINQSLPSEESDPIPVIAETGKLSLCIKPDLGIHLRPWDFNTECYFFHFSSTKT